ncbi:hypothetical protein WJX75_002389 [Coccomyxa subellipsoidea]|uniref:Uncharacterized protein n=1 Tax=Coccomyxa subellipsoidea TaxID=248742 RepID=A0ABR2YAM7_9CHLO
MEWPKRMSNLYMVMQLFRDIAGCPINTTSHIEGWHSTLKGTFLTEKRRLTNRFFDSIGCSGFCSPRWQKRLQ